MGLDMYLNAKRYLYSYNKEGGDGQLSEQVRELAKVPEGFDVKEIKVNAGYWRKANQIHRWFVNNVQEGKDDCDCYYVGRQDLIDLQALCNKVLQDHSLAPTDLPTESGFFFGETTYDDWYYSDLSETVDILDKALSLSNEWEFEYHSSW